MKIKKALCIVLAFMLILSVFSGCRLSHYEEDEIAQWAKENFDEPVKISSDYFTRPSSEGDYTDRVWTAHLKSNPDLEFEIISHEYWGMESIAHSIETTYHYVYGKHYFDLYSNKNSTDFVPSYDEVVTSSYRLEAKFDDRNDLSNIIDQAEDIGKYMEEKGIEESVRFFIEYNDPLITAKVSNVSEYADCSSSLDDVEETLLNDFRLYAADYRLALDQFTEDEIIEAVSNSKYGFAVIRTDGSEIVYPDLAESRFGYGISFGCLYEILAREGFYPYGTPENFTFMGIDGSYYEFSYDFNDYDFGGNTGYYYFKDGVKIPMSYYFYNHFRTDFLKKISGLSFDDID